MSPEDLTTLGFPSWLSLYKFLLEKDQHNSVRVKMIEARAPAIMGAQSILPAAPVIVVVEYVKARAFEELFNALPTRETIDILLEIATECAFKVQDARLIATYLTKHPTRTQ